MTRAELAVHFGRVLSAALESEYADGCKSEAVIIGFRMRTAEGRPIVASVMMGTGGVEDVAYGMIATELQASLEAVT